MKTENLVSGMIIKNYKELCSLLDVPVKVGKSKILQVQDFERYFKYHKIKNAFIIDEVYEVANSKVDKRKDPKKVSNNSLYSKDIQSLIIDILAQAKGNAVYLSTNAFLRKLDMINDNYTVGRKYIPKLSELTQVPQETCYDFYNNTNIKLRDKLETALRGLRNRALVMWTHSITVCVRVSEHIRLNDMEDVVLDDNNIVSFRVKTVHRKASDEEKKLILKTERDVLLSMKYSSLQEAFLGGKWKEYKDRVNTILLEKANIEYYYTSYEVIYNHEHIIKAKQQKLNANERRVIQNNLNSNINKFINTNAKTTQNRVLKKAYVNSNELVQISKDYLTHTKVLAETVIKKDAENITEELLKATNPIKIEQMSFCKIVDKENDELPF